MQRMAYLPRCAGEERRSTGVAVGIPPSFAGEEGSRREAVEGGRQLAPALPYSAAIATAGRWSFAMFCVNIAARALAAAS